MILSTDFVQNFLQNNPELCFFGEVVFFTKLKMKPSSSPSISFSSLPKIFSKDSYFWEYEVVVGVSKRLKFFPSIIRFMTFVTYS
jgi:hypothetical protein